MPETVLQPVKNEVAKLRQKMNKLWTNRKKSTKSI